MGDLPDWLNTELDDARRLFLINDAWRIGVTIEESDEFDGECEPDAEYLNATIKFNAELGEKDECYRRRIVRHEVLHIALAEVDQVVEDMLCSLAQGEQMALRKAYRRSVERFIQRLTRGLMYHEAADTK